MRFMLHVIKCAFYWWLLNYEALKGCFCVYYKKKIFERGFGHLKFDYTIMLDVYCLVFCM